MHRLEPEQQTQQQDPAPAMDHLFRTGTGRAGTHVVRTTSQEPAAPGGADEATSKAEE
ncbi:hypothetical protein AnaeK_2016 [Anaeromyxobacter sp. K]|uniref:hypothetical protein n=1 Tax=Anaeromyxobacter sp. (strain K) TaxID=447217 RepID=UPI00015F8915|nr:hypothetical protein [Anaeromyxobacter sp. K]ACG73244.1 hypothetical protein AnaeK_2016 [Anaeromyxobacter sp. K]